MYLPGYSREELFDRFHHLRRHLFFSRPYSVAHLDSSPLGYGLLSRPYGVRVFETLFLRRNIASFVELLSYNRYVFVCLLGKEGTRVCAKKVHSGRKNEE